MKSLREAIKNLESSIAYMSKNNPDGTLDAALSKHKEALPKARKMFRYYLSKVPGREDEAAAAA